MVAASKMAPNNPRLVIFIYYLNFFPALLRSDCITLYKFKGYNLMIWYAYILQNDYHNVSDV